MTAQEFQHYLQVADHEIILYGYTVERESLFIYFEKGQLIRLTEKNKQVNRESYNYLVPGIWRSKRFYPNGTNPRLRSLMNSFAVLSETNLHGRYNYGELIPEEYRL
jgi:hypothetical protein